MTPAKEQLLWLPCRDRGTVIGNFGREERIERY